LAYKIDFLSTFEADKIDFEVDFRHPQKSTFFDKPMYEFNPEMFSVLGSDMEDPDDPTVIAENELLGAAASIDAAAKKLASLRPRRSVQVSCPFVCMCVRVVLVEEGRGSFRSPLWQKKEKKWGMCLCGGFFQLLKYCLP